MSLPEIDFRLVRPHAGNRWRGFEELCFQLLPCLERLPAGGRLMRHGTPDGGVEFRLELPDGTVWGWQAKYLFDLDQSALAQLDRSVESALQALPRLVRYTVLMPCNLSPPRAEHGKSAEQRWDDRAATWRSWAKGRGMAVDFRYIGESDLLAALTQPQNAGATYYWFDQRVLAPLWFQRKVEDAIAVAGDRYTPMLHLDVSISHLFEGLSRTPLFDQQFRSLARGVRRTREHASRMRGEIDVESALAPLLRDLDQRLGTILNGIEATDLLDPTSLIDVEGLTSACRKALRIIAACQRTSSADRATLREALPPNAVEPPQRTHETLYVFERAVSSVITFLRGPSARLANRPAMLVTGEAGTGKTHLLCHIAEQQVGAGRPGILLFGVQFCRTEHPLTTIVSHLGLACNQDELLGALDAAAAAVRGRALILIDAINDSADPAAWQAHLPQLLSTLARHPRIGLVLSCRTTFLDMVVPSGGMPSALTPVEHRGFVGRSTEARKRFFDHYRLLLPDFPMSFPELDNPLFLKLVCQALKREGLVTLPREAAAFSWVYDKYLDHLDAELSDPNRCDYARAQRLAAGAVARLADAMIDRETDRLPFDAAQKVVDARLPGRAYSRSLLHGLLVRAGVLRKDVMRVAGVHQEVVSFAYQRFGDFARARALSERGKDAAVEWLGRRAAEMGGLFHHAGLVEALAIELLERFGLEAHEAVPDPERGHPVFQRAFLRSLPWRGADSFHVPRSLDYLNAITRSGSDGGDEVLEALLEVACIPGHPLNAVFLDGNLRRRPLPERDATWSAFLHGHHDDGSAVRRIIEWAWFADTSSCADDGAYPCALTLTWFLSAPHGWVRDASTKALVALLRTRLGLLRKLLAHFAGVDDPYVAERLYAAAYGCAMISQDSPAVGELARTVYELVFAHERPPVSLLLRDHARGIVERARYVGRLPPGLAFGRTQPPYFSPWPPKAPPAETMEQPPYNDPEYHTLHRSLLEWDFLTYVIAPSVCDFVPRAQARQKPTPATDGAVPGDWFDSREAARWIFARVLQLGWAPHLFKSFDERVAKTVEGGERVGKKYQWIGLDEFLAMLSDHVPFRESWGEKPRRCRGAWEVYWARRIDPSVVEEESPIDRVSAGAWWVPDVVQPADLARQDKGAWIERCDDWPDPRRLVEVRGQGAHEWLALEGDYEWTEPVPPEFEQSEIDRSNCWMQIRSYFVRRREAPRFEAWAAKQRWGERWMPESQSIGHAYLGGIRGVSPRGTPWAAGSAKRASAPSRLAFE